MSTLALLVFEVPPRVSYVFEIKQRLAETRARLAAAQGWETELAHLHAEREWLEEGFTALALDRPRGDEASVVLSALQDAAAGAGLTLTTLRPLERESESAYDRLPVEVRVRGRFPSVLAFLRSVEASSTPMRVREIAIEVLDPTALDVEAAMVLDVLTLKPPAATPLVLPPLPASQRARP